MHAFHRKRSKTKRITEARGEFFKLHHAARFRLFVDAIERGHAHVLEPGGHAFVGGEHEFFDEAVGPGALGFGYAAHLPVFIKLDHRLGKIEVDAAAFFTAAVHAHGEIAHEFEVGSEFGIRVRGLHYRPRESRGPRCRSCARRTR